jgi:hypothetical protein
MKLPLYLYSNKNLVASSCAIVAVLAYLAGIIHDFWWEIVIGVYALPALAIPGHSGTGVSFDQSMNDADLVAKLESLAERSAKLLAPEQAQKVGEICSLLEAAIPAISAKNYPDQLAHDVRTTASEYLPETIDAYLRMPPAFRNVQKLQDGKTASQTFDEQLGLLETHLQSVASDLAANDASSLLANGRFLREKFATPEFLGIG